MFQYLAYYFFNGHYIVKAIKKKNIQSSSTYSTQLRHHLLSVRSWTHKMACWCSIFLTGGLNRIALETAFDKRIKPQDQMERKVSAAFFRESAGRQKYPTEVSLMSRSINFMNPRRTREPAATHVLNGSCRWKKMPLCWNKWWGENGVKMSPLRCINLHLFTLTSLCVLLEDTHYTVDVKTVVSEGSSLYYGSVNWFIYSCFKKTQLPCPPSVF